MSSLQESQPKRICLKKDEVESLTKEQLIEKWFQQEKYIDILETKPNEADNSELVSLRESEEKLKQQQLEATRRENILVMRLTTKEQEMQEYANQIQELKQGQIPTVAQLRSALLDPAVNLMFERLRKELESTKARLEETQNELSAWKFTPDSNTGKRLMAKCRLLYQENEELGKMISSGRMAKLEGDLALQRNFSEEMKKSQNELDEFLLELDEDVEGMQNTIYYLQQQLKESKDHISSLQHEKRQLSYQALKDKASSLRTASPVPVIVKNECRPILEVMANGKSSPDHKSAVNINCMDKSHFEDDQSEVSDQVKNVMSDSVDTNEVPSPMQIETLESISVETDDTVIKLKEEIIAKPEKKDLATHSFSVIVDSSFEVDHVSKVKEKETSGESKLLEVGRVSSPPDNHERLKRTRDSTDESDVTQSPKRPKHNGDASPTLKEEPPSVDVDTDTEKQVAEMLVCWASANKGRMETQSAEQTCLPVGNGEVDDSSSISD